MSTEKIENNTILNKNKREREKKYIHQLYPDPDLFCTRQIQETDMHQKKNVLQLDV